MNYVSVYFYVIVLLCVCLYYLLPEKNRWISLLIGNVVFYASAAKEACLFFLISSICSWLLGHIIERIRRSDSRNIVKKIGLWGTIVIIIIPLFVVKYLSVTINLFTDRTINGFIVPLGISFYTLRMISYIVDIYWGKYKPEYNFWKYLMFISFFPLIIQGPIARYDQMKTQLFAGNKFEEKKFVKGLQLIIWGFFLKMMIADKSAVIVNTVFENHEMYVGWYVVLAGILYSIQLYTDFMACVTISQGVSSLFGIEIMDNFMHPYMATSVKDFWRRWHISLSSWLRDYVYIPLGGNRKGIIGKYINLMITFIISGIWHGAGYKYILWGMMHGVYQIIGDITLQLKNKIYCRLGIDKEHYIRRWIGRTVTFSCVMLAWIIFRADSLSIGIQMIRNIFAVNNIWILFDWSILNLGLSGKQLIVLLISIATLIKTSMMQEKICVRDYILSMNIVCRWGLYIGSILVIVTFGTYGYGFNALDFIYGGF